MFFVGHKRIRFDIDFVTLETQNLRRGYGASLSLLPF